MTDKADKPIVILLCGWAGSGKDAVAAILTRECGFTRMAFADALKEDAAACTGFPLSLFHDTRLKDAPLPAPCVRYPAARTPRDILLEHGRRERALDPDVYSRHIADAIANTVGVARFVISDWRFRAEGQFLTNALSDSCRILRWRVTRPGIRPSTDVSENDLNDWEPDIIVSNDGTLDALRVTVLGAMSLV